MVNRLGNCLSLRWSGKPPFSCFWGNTRVFSHFFLVEHTWGCINSVVKGCGIGKGKQATVCSSHLNLNIHVVQRDFGLGCAQQWCNLLIVPVCDVFWCTVINSHGSRLLASYCQNSIPVVVTLLRTWGNSPVQTFMARVQVMHNLKAFDSVSKLLL